MAKKMIIKGVGTFMAKRAAKDGKGLEVITLGTLQDLKIDLNVELEDIFGGDGLFSIDTLVKSKSIEISAQDAKFDLDALQVMMGSRIEEQVNDYVWVLNEQGTLVSGGLDPAAATPVSVSEYVPQFAGGSTPTIYGDGNFAVRIKDENKLLTKVAYSTTVPPTDTEFMFEPTSGRIIVADAHTGKELVVNYQREEKVDIVDLLTDEVPFPLHVIHHGSFLQKDGSYEGIETEIYQTRAKGTFSIDAARATASSSSIQLQVLDPERADKKLGSIKRYSSATKV